MRRWVIFAGLIAALELPQHLAAQAPAPYGQHPVAKGGQLRDIVMSLSPAGQQIFREQWLKLEHQQSAQRHAAVEAANDAVFSAINAEPFNGQALRHAYADLRAANFNNQRQRHENLVTVLVHLSPTDRHLVADRLGILRGH